MAKHKKSPICPICDKPAPLTMTAYGARHECCGLHSWGYKPLTNKETHEARIKAHEAFDQLWPELMTRNNAYRMLATELGMTKKQCHISRMNKGECALVIAFAKRIKDE